MGKLLIRTHHFKLWASPASNEERIRQLAQEFADQGWTLRGQAVYEGFMYLTFQKKEKGDHSK